MEIVTFLQASQYIADVYLDLLWGFLFNQQSFSSLKSFRNLTDFNLLLQAEAPAQSVWMAEERRPRQPTKDSH